MVPNAPLATTMLVALYCCTTPARAESPTQAFSIADQIALTFFGGPEGARDWEGVTRFSPNGAYLAVHSAHGNLANNSVEDELRFYRTKDVESFLKDPTQSPPLPFWTSSSENTIGPAIESWRWLPDSSGVYFVQPSLDGLHHLMSADVQEKRVRSLSLPQEDVLDYIDVRDPKHLGYAARSPGNSSGAKAPGLPPARVVTSRRVWDVVFPYDHATSVLRHLWVRFGDERREIDVADDLGPFALSPDARTIVTVRHLPLPTDWHRGDRREFRRPDDVAGQWVKIDVATGTMESLTDAPVGNDVGWGELGVPVYSDDGRYVALPNTFLSGHELDQPCNSVVEVVSRKAECLESVGSPSTGMRFSGHDGRRLLIGHLDGNLGSPTTTEYLRLGTGQWKVGRTTEGALGSIGPNGLTVSVRQDVNTPPVLVASHGGDRRTLWDPNPHLANVGLRHVEIVSWKDDIGREWHGGLYRPTDQKSGQRWPLVIQTHGFSASYFLPSGVFPTGFAAQALAANGIAVLQVGLSCPMGGADEPPCAVAGYAAGARKLIDEGVVDPDNIGLIGFSRTVMYTMMALTTHVPHLKAASVTDGVMLDHFEYMLGGYDEPEHMVGAQPFGVGVQQWIDKAPSFNFDKVSAALLVNGAGPSSTLSMWWPYAGLELLRKPVDLMVFNMDNGPNRLHPSGTLPYEHVLTNPGFRLASQGTTVDWFRFWLKDEEGTPPSWDPDRYVRWRGLKNLQAANDAKARAGAH